MPDPWTAAWEEAEAMLPPGVQQFQTLEFQHAAFVQGGTPFAVRFVADTADDQTFTLEAGALPLPTLAEDDSLTAVGGGGQASFIAVPFRAGFPEVAEGTLPSVKIVIDNVARELVPWIWRLIGFRADLIIIFRIYRSDDLTEPAYGPFSLVGRNIAMIGTTLTITASIENLGNRKFPSRLYTIAQFPGLLTQ